MAKKKKVCLSGYYDSRIFEYSQSLKKEKSAEIQTHDCVVRINKL